MQKEEQIKKTKYALILLLVSAFAGTFVLTQLTPLVADDYNYAFSWSYHIRIDNMTLLWHSMRAHRIWTNGRVFADRKSVV